MITVITGGSGSGKSVYAESYIMKLKEGKEPCFYIATMQPFGDEGRKRVEKHRAQRAGKGFITIECYQDLKPYAKQVSGGIVLLECMSNFVANQMFSGFMSKQIRNSNEYKSVLKQWMQEQIQAVAEKAKHLVIVTNEVFSDGMQYEKETMDYIELLGEMNQVLMGMADEAVEVVYTIPIVLFKRED